MSDRDIALVRAALEAAARVADKHWLDTSYHAASEIRELDPAAIAATVPVTSCAWTEDESGEYWETECGKAFTITSGTPSDNEMRYCCYCGQLLREEVKP